jgi:hypothetical protein
MTAPEIYRVRPSIPWKSLALTGLGLAAGLLIGRGLDNRDWQFSTQTTRIVMTDPATGMVQEQFQSGTNESLTTPEPPRFTDLFGGADDSDAK